MADVGAKRDSIAAGDFVLYCRGDVRLYCASADCTPKSKKGRALLAVLAAEQRPLSRVRLIDLLWSDRQEEQARASLRTLLADLKEQFGGRFDALLVVDRERVALAAGVRTDLIDPALARPAGELFEGLDHIDPELDEWLRTERDRWRDATPGPSTQQWIAADPAAAPRWRFIWAAAAGIALLVAAALFYFWSPGQTRTPVVAVLKIQDTTGRHALLSEAIAEEIRLGLAQNPGIEVIGRASSEDPSIIAAGASGVATRLGASHIVEGSIVPRGRQLHLAVRLLDASSGRTLWDGAANAQGADLTFDAGRLAEGIAEYLTDVLMRRAPLHALRADANTWAALLEARAAIASGDLGARQREPLQDIVRAHPNFVPALVALSRATMQASDHPFYRGTLPLAQARREAAFYARRAVAIAPDYAPAYDALAGAYRDMDEAMPFLRKALTLSPGLAMTHRRLAWELEQNGDFAAALEHWRTAARLDPLNRGSHVQLLRALDFDGRRDEMRRVGDAYAARLSDPLVRFQVEAVRATYEGDISRSLVSLIQAERIAPNDQFTHRIMMFALAWLFGPEAALPYAGERDSFTALLLERDTSAIIRKVEAAGPDFFRLNFETSNVGEHLASIGRRDVLIRAYDRARASRHPPTVSDLGMVGDHIVLGLREAGRTREASQLLDGLAAELEQVRGLRTEYRDVNQAFFDMLRGNPGSAAARLHRAYQTEWNLMLLNEGRPGYQFETFAPIRNDPRIIELRRRYQREMAREAHEAIDEMIAEGIRPRRCRAIPRVCPRQQERA